MVSYVPPLRELRFVLHELLDAEAVFADFGTGEAGGAGLTDAILEEAARLCAEVLLPLNAPGDAQGCRLEDGAVRTPDGFVEAYRALTEGGWMGLSCAPEHGGQGLPETLKFAVEEMICSANVAFSLYPGLTHGAYRTLRRYASASLQATYLPKLANGQWTGTMCLTEAHCGTDLGLLRTRAVPQADGTHRITGSKIFISGGDHDLAENIVHLVLARLPDAPAGVKGISLFVVPKYLPDADDRPGERNAVACTGLEEKMGIHAASTCVMTFDEAQGWLLGEPHRGLQAMFSMMNHERLWVGLQGLGIAETAYQSAVAHARERRQGRAPGARSAEDGSADPIIVHPDVRRMLLTTRAYVQGARALYLWTALHIDRAERHGDAAVREASAQTVALLTPIIKAFLSDIGYEAAGTCQQVFGGHGYIRESGMEQLVRDARVTQIYEGTNGVQALDLVGRKLPMEGGAVLGRYLDELRACAEAHREQPGMAEFLRPFEAAIERLDDVASGLLAAMARDAAAAGAGATDFLRLMGLTVLAHMWVLGAARALPALADDPDGFYAAKLDTARYYLQRLLPQTLALAEAVRCDPALLMSLPAEAF